MRRMTAAILLAAALVGSAGAQTLGARAPEWAQRLIVADLDSQSGGRPTLAVPGQELVARVAIAPIQGGVARVIRIELPRDAEGGRLFLRRFTGHPRNGWFLWGPDSAAVAPLTPAQHASLLQLARAAIAPGAAAADPSLTCADGDSAYLEVATAGRIVGGGRPCVSGDAAGRFVAALSDLAGSADEAALQEAAIAELLAADRAFNDAAAEDGAPAAFVRFAHPDVVLFRAGRAPYRGKDGVRARFADWPAGAQLRWRPLEAQVAARGDMGWTYGEGVYEGPGAPPAASLYVTVWRRDLDGAWRYVTDIGVAGPAAPALAAPAPPR